MIAKLKTSLILKVIVTMVVVISIVLGYGMFWIWYQTTGYKEQNQFSYKPQESPGYVNIVEGTVPVDSKETKVQSRDQAKKLRNPAILVSRSIKEGGKKYQIYCAVCHGENGDGKGVMGTSPGLAPVSTKENIVIGAYIQGYTQVPTNVDVNFVSRLTDGEIFYIITNGGQNIMPSLKDALTPEERWDVINFIKWGFTRDFRK